MLFNRILLCICFLFSFISYKSLSAPVSDGMCILLKQQVQQFSHAKQSRSYRQAKRAFDQGCYRAKVNKSSTQSVSNETKTAKEIPTEVKVVTLSEKGKNPIITLTSMDNQLLGAVAAKIRSLRKPEPYKGKGIKYVGEQLRRKAGKTAAK